MSAAVVAPPSVVDHLLTEMVAFLRPSRQNVAIVSDQRSRPPLSVEQAFERVRGGDRTAFGVVYDDLSPKVFGTVRRVLRDPAMSEEVTQEVFVELWETAPRFDSTRASLSTWATTIARRRAVDRVRHEQSQRNRIEAAGARRDDADPSIDAVVIDNSQAEAVRAAVASLPSDQAEVIRLSFIEGRAHNEIADVLGIPLGTVKGRVRGGLKKLKSKLGAEHG